MNKELKEAIIFFYNLRATIDESKMLFDEGISIECGNEMIKQITTVLNYIENSIPKEKVEEEIEELKDMKVEGEVFKTSVNFAIKILQELLEGK